MLRNTSLARVSQHGSDTASATRNGSHKRRCRDTTNHFVHEVKIQCRRTGQPQLKAYSFEYAGLPHGRLGRHRRVFEQCWQEVLPQRFSKRGAFHRWENRPAHRLALTAVGQPKVRRLISLLCDSECETPKLVRVVVHCPRLARSSCRGRPVRIPTRHLGIRTLEKYHCPMLSTWKPAED